MEDRKRNHAPPRSFAERTLETLHTVQSSFGYVDNKAITFVARSLRVPLSEAYGVDTFYNHFTMKPPGRHTCSVCTGTACYVNGADRLLADVEKRLGIKEGETTVDGNVSLTAARCVGSCGRAPVVVLDGELVGKAETAEVFAQFERWNTSD